VAGALLIFAGVAVVVGRQLILIKNTLPDHADEIKAKAEALKNWLNATEGGRWSTLINDVYETFGGVPPKKPGPGTPTVVVESAEPGWVGRIQTILSPAAEVAGQAAFTFVLLVFILNRREDLRNRMIRLLGQGQVTTTTKAVDETSRRVSKFLLVQFLLNATFGTVVTLGLLFIGVPYAPLWGFLGFLMRYVPYIGSWIAVIPPLLLSVAVSDGWTHPILVFALFIGLELIAGNVAEPLLFGHSLGISEVAQLVAAAFWAFLWGPVGLILSGPLTVCLLVLGKYVPQWTFLDVLLGDEPVLSPRVAFYQRLTARDHDEAEDILEKELSTRPVEEVCDDVLVPVLAAARHDAAAGRSSEDDLRFVANAVRELAEDVIEVEPGTPSENQARVPVAVLPAKDDVDRAAAEVFAKLFDPARWDVGVAPAGALTSEVVEFLDRMKPAIAVIAVLPPGGLTHTRYLCKRLQQRFPELKIVIGRWAAPEDDRAGWANLRTAGVSEITRTLGATKTFLVGWRAVLVAGPTPTRDDAEKPDGRLVGTTSA
jgi:predicted PurR-regulated permease PerM